MTDFYTLPCPSAWAKAPVRWSHSTLAGISVCPRRWQLTRSEWGEYKGFPQRQHPSAVKGIIIHDGLDRLARACGRLGMPTIGSPLFLEALSASAFFRFFPDEVEKWNHKLRSHPRHGPNYTMRVNPGDLANVAIRQFRAQYHPKDEEPAKRQRPRASTHVEPMKLHEMLTRQSMLSEIELRHPSLPFMGKVDRIQLSGGAVVIVDFKSGTPKPDHRVQLERYALLWWRSTGVVPGRATAQYLDTKANWSLDEGVLSQVEEVLRDEIGSSAESLEELPAKPKPGEVCRFCPVRARCTEGWALVDTGKVSNGAIDMEVTVASKPSSAGFVATSRREKEVNVVHQKPIQTLLPPLAVGDVIRIVGGRGTEKSKELEIKAWTETYLIEGGY